MDTMQCHWPCKNLFYIRSRLKFILYKKNLINTEKHFILEAAHPSPLARGAFFGNKHFSKSLVIIYTLQTSLDFEKGGEIATQLFQVYEYCRQQLIKGFRSQVVEGINKAINALKEIFDNTYIKKQNAWSQKYFIEQSTK